MFKSLRSTMLFIAIPPFLLILGLLGLTIINTTAENIEREEGEKLLAEAKFFAELTDMTIGRQLIDLQSRAALIPILELIDQPDKFAQWMNAIQQSIPEYAWIGFADQHGNVKAATGKILVGENVSAREWFIKAQTQPVTVDVHEAKLLAKYLPRREGEPWRFVDIAAPVFDRKGNPVGVLGAHLSWDWLVNQHQRFSDSLTRRQHAEVIVADNDGSIRLVGANFGTGSINHLASFAQALNGRSGWLKETWPDEKTYVVGYTFNPGFNQYHQLGWVTLIRFPEESIFGLASPAIRGVWMLFASAVLLFMVAVWVLSQMSIRPVKDLLEQISLTSRHGGTLNLNQPMPSEFKILGDATNQLISQVEQRTKADLAKTRFMADLSHELRNALNVVIGYAQLLLPRMREPQDQKDAHALLLSAKTASSIANHSLDLSMIAEGQLRLHHQVFEIDEVIDSCTALAQIRADQKQVSLIIENTLPPKLRLLGDSTRIGQVINNLLQNAIKFTPQGVVRLLISAEPISDTQINLQIIVSDTGIGLSESAQEIIFGRFRQASSDAPQSAEGSGLGLAITASLVQNMRGSIHLNSKQHSGSTFTVALPLTIAPQTMQDNPFSSAVRSAPAKRLAVLVVDDLDTNRDILVRWLESLGHAVQESATAQNAVVKAASRPFHLILMDLDLPDMSGWDAARAIRSGQGPSSKAAIFAISGHAYDHDAQTSASVGIDLHLSKPIHFETLLREIEKL
jgi:signal transduction histidine kinase